MAPTRGARGAGVALGLNSLRTRLFLSFGFLVLLALILAAGVFIALRRGPSDRDTLARVAAASPAISFELRSLYDRGASPQQLQDYLHQAARDHHVRILLVDWRDGTVVEDSRAALRGRRLELPSFSASSAAEATRFRSWHGTSADTRDLTFFTGIYPPTGRPFTLGRTAADPGSNLITIVAVPRETVGNAWLGLLPGLLWAGLVALALSAVMAVLLARSIARPVLALTRASEAMAKGNFDQEVPLTSPDEIRRLASSFNSMAREVGHSYLQTRALIANVSHDLKTPLTSILGFAQALRDGAAQEPDEVRELSGIIHEEAARIFSIVEDLLYISQLEAGEVLLHAAPVQLGEAAARALRRVEPAARARALTIESCLDPPVWVLADTGKLERILDNLLDNATKYTPEGGRVVVVSAVATENPREAALTVYNSGSYIGPDELERIFDRFYRTDRSRGSATRGTGLGLAIVRDLVRLQHGSIHAESRRGDGTTFEVRLPVVAPATRTAERLPREREPSLQQRAAPDAGPAA